MLLEKSLILLQLLSIFIFIFLTNRRTNFTGRYFSPYHWFVFFIIFWFIVPQIISVFPPYSLVGLGFLGEDTRKDMIVYGQISIFLFLFSLSIAYVFFRSVLSKNVPTEQVFNASFLTKKDLHILYWLFLIGVLCIFKLGVTFQSIEGMRSQLVKSFEGKLLTAIAFWANFSFSVLLAYFVVKKKYYRALLLLALFSSAILLTGARGRLLWPLLISFIFLSIYYRKFPIVRISVIGFLMVSILVLLDPLMIAIREGNISDFFEYFRTRDIFSALFLKRNFDSFSNLSLNVYFDAVEHNWIRLFTGARNAFMEQYFPAIYNSGVGFGVTYPGTAFLGLGWLGIVLFGSFFGFVGGFLSLMIERKMTVIQMFSYLTLMPWLCALGGNFVENFDKMIAAIFPGVIWYFFKRVKYR